MLSVFLPIGWPDPKKFAKLCKIAVENGAGALELGCPYSDPVADGPVLQAAYREALAEGSTTARCLAGIESVAGLGVPLNLLVYANLVHARPSFCEDARKAGAHSLLVPDVPLEECAELREATLSAGLQHVALVGPLTSRERLGRIARTVTGYLYVAGVQGITGNAEDPGLDIVRSAVATERPVYVGFGIRNRAQVENVLGAGAQSAIVGSALVEVGKDEKRFGRMVAELAGR
ncbi:MAG: tryptophan synthase subunit alpha [Deltaproteobacteria bacterium]|nr:tryptophan synthase subunit alpha [Deltaproteobacteria bacterium]